MPKARCSADGILSAEDSAHAPLSERKNSRTTLRQAACARGSALRRDHDPAEHPPRSNTGVYPAVHRRRPRGDHRGRSARDPQGYVDGKDRDAMLAAHPELPERARRQGVDFCLPGGESMREKGEEILRFANKQAATHKDADHSHSHNLLVRNDQSARVGALWT